MAILKTYDLKGNKLSFANWISNLSPTDTPFASMIKKEAVDQTMYSWQTDRLASPSNPVIAEGSEFAPEILAPTQVMSNFTQILRKVVRVTDTANKVGLYGRASETAYQMEKAGREIKRDLERAMLTQIEKDAGTKTTARWFSGFQGLVAAEGLPCKDTGAVVHKSHQPANVGDPAFTKTEIFDITYNLYLAGSKASKIMVHPMHMATFAGFISGHAWRMFDNVETKYNMHIRRLRDPLGQEFDIIPNRFMPKNKIYFFNENDWSQMVLREPKSEKLARMGSCDVYMIEMEVGLRHRNPFASGILTLVPNPAGADVKTMGVSLSHDSIALNNATGAVTKASKLTVTMYLNGAVDTTHTGANVTVTSDPTAGINIAALTWKDGVGTADISQATTAGVYTIKVSETSGPSGSASLLVHSADLRKAEDQEEAPVAPKATRAKK